MRIWILSAVFVSFHCAPAHLAAQQSNLNQVLSWLPVNTETVLGTNGPFVWDPKALSNEPPSQEPLTARALEIQSRMFPLTLLNFKSGGYGEFVKGKTVALAIEGSRRFRAPRALGLMRYEGCLIMVFVPTVSLDGAAFMRAAANSAVRFEDHNGTKVAVFEEKSEDDTWNTFVGFPRSNVAIVATNLDYLVGVLDRMRGTPTTRALPANLSEWKHVDTNAPVWGLRHYQKQGAELDPSSPLLGQNAANVPDANAVGVTFSFAPAAERTASVDYFSTNPDVRRILSGYLMMEDAATAAPQEFQMRLRQPTAGVLEASISLSATEAIGRLLFGLMAMVGHAIYL
jgi:hypothetical protein